MCSANLIGLSREAPHPVPMVAMVVTEPASCVDIIFNWTDWHKQHDLIISILSLSLCSSVPLYKYIYIQIYGYI